MFCSILSFRSLFDALPVWLLVRSETNCFFSTLHSSIFLSILRHFPENYRDLEPPACYPGNSTKCLSFSSRRQRPQSSASGNCMHSGNTARFTQIYENEVLHRAIERMIPESSEESSTMHVMRLHHKLRYVSLSTPSRIQGTILLPISTEGESIASGSSLEYHPAVVTSNHYLSLSAVEKEALLNTKESQSRLSTFRFAAPPGGRPHVLLPLLFIPLPLLLSLPHGRRPKL